MIYHCKRCGYLSKYKCNMKTHYQRKFACKPLESNISYTTLKSQFFLNHYKLNPIEPKLNPNEPKLNPIEPKLNPIEPKMNLKKKFICEYCNKSYSTNSHMRRHQKKMFK